MTRTNNIVAAADSHQPGRAVLECEVLANRIVSLLMIEPSGRPAIGNVLLACKNMKHAASLPSSLLNDKSPIDIAKDRFVNDRVDSAKIEAQKLAGPYIGPYIAMADQIENFDLHEAITLRDQFIDNHINLARLNAELACKGEATEDDIIALASMSLAAQFDEMNSINYLNK